MSEWLTNHKTGNPFPASRELPKLSAEKDEKGLWTKPLEQLGEKEQLKNVRFEFIDDYIRRHGFEKIGQSLRTDPVFAPRTIYVYKDKDGRYLEVHEYTGRQEGRIEFGIDYADRPEDYPQFKFHKQIDKFRDWVERRPSKKVVVKKPQPRKTPLYQLRPGDNIVLTAPHSRRTVEGKAEVAEYDRENKNYKLIIREPNGELFDATWIANGFKDSGGHFHRGWWVTRVGDTRVG